MVFYFSQLGEAEPQNDDDDYDAGDADTAQEMTKDVFLCVLGGRGKGSVVIERSCKNKHVSRKNKPLTLYYTGWLIGIRIMAYHNPQIIG